MSIICSAKITSKGQVTIPVKIRKKLGLLKGDILSFLEEEEGSIYLFGRRKDPLETLDKLRQGKWYPELGSDLEKSRKEARHEKSIY